MLACLVYQSINLLKLKIKKKITVMGYENLLIQIPSNWMVGRNLFNWSYICFFFLLYERDLNSKLFKSREDTNVN
jgi:hypothetical protein